MKIVATDFKEALGGLLVLWKDNLIVDIIFDEGNIFLNNFHNLKDHES